MHPMIRTQRLPNCASIGSYFFSNHQQHNGRQTLANTPHLPVIIPPLPLT